VEPKFKTSFIPKQSLESSVAPQRAPRKRVGLGLGSFISLIVFLAAVGLSAGLFLYERYLTESIATKKDTRDAFQPALIRELTRLDTRIQAAKEILELHVAPSAIFGILEQVTLESVRYDSFDYSNDNGFPTISMAGVATDFEAVALQSDAYGENNFLIEPVVSDLDSDEGTITFAFKASVEPQTVSFIKNLALFEALAGVESSLPASAADATFNPDDALLNTDDVNVDDLNIDDFGF
jgi:hypothetical protein